MPGTGGVGPGAATADVTAGLLGRCTFPPPGSPLVCAVSGGADSLALLALACAAGCDVTAVHVDHGLRPGSAGDAAVVGEAAARFGAGFRALRVEVGHGPNLEARARAARRRVLPPGAATGHTMDDQAETVLVNLLRGAGLDGLAAMRPGPEHPVLGLRAAETRALCSALGLGVVDDPTNADPRFVRNRIRHELLPLACAVAGRDLVPVLARQAGVLAGEADLLDSLASAVDATDAAALAAAPVPLARRAARRWLRGASPHPPDLAAVERVLAVARGALVATEVAPGVRVRRRRGAMSSAPVASGATSSAPVAPGASGSVGGR
jgi:tRNA(Ile)-lysidine synthase